MKLLILVILFSISNAYAFTSDDLLHPVAHTAGSYMLTHAGEVVCRKATTWSKTTCSIVSGTVATATGVAVELTQRESGKNHAKSLLENATGVILAIGIIHLDF